MEKNLFMNKKYITNINSDKSQMKNIAGLNKDLSHIERKSDDPNPRPLINSINNSFKAFKENNNLISEEFHSISSNDKYNNSYKYSDKSPVNTPANGTSIAYQTQQYSTNCEAEEENECNYFLGKEALSNINSKAYNESNNKNIQVIKTNKENINMILTHNSTSRNSLHLVNKRSYNNPTGSNFFVANTGNNFENSSITNNINNGYKIEMEDQEFLKQQKYFLDKIENIKHVYIKNILKKFESSQNVLKVFVNLFLKATAKPWEIFLDIFMPNSSDGIFLLIRFFIPLFFIWNFSEIELYFLEKIMARLKLPPSFLGLTIMSWGNNAPDMFNVASAMSRGLVDLAMNAAIASEMHNILLGLGLPWVVYNCTMGKPISFEITNLYAFTLLFFALFLLCFVLILKLNRNKFDKKLALFLICVYGIFFTIIFFISFKLKLF